MKDLLNLIGIPFVEAVKKAIPELDIKEARTLLVLYSRGGIR